MIAALVAMSENNVIGLNNKMPWHLPQELAYFKKVTTGYTIIMGRKTFDSIGRPLPNRENIVVTRQKDFQAEGVIVINDVISYVEENKNKDLFIIGGAEIFNLTFPYLDTLYITEIEHNFEGDTFFPNFSKDEWNVKSVSDVQVDEKSKIKFRYFVYEKKY
ncbi:MULTISPECIES: dihydrofolate reductase [Bacillaceae]|uniref:Dihydrofolate reductase n=1 Tax=Gottfriedia luciferensis TaxID=178774 RepID=A0ABX2ZVH2_9BACI|nr:MULTISPECIES: dihydrofolate reductase [Bacillaceae]ODG93815.1 dihydrofolate reductase [Gottfriedia luciferensis]PGZ87356.1 dihydrofolate reductase [Bacillus sp. AFS029533]SFC28672.1 dihydrofolate reductase [Bacillus sp. UNCCL81]